MPVTGSFKFRFRGFAVLYFILIGCLVGGAAESAGEFEPPGTLSQLLRVEGVQPDSQMASFVEVLIKQVEMRWRGLAQLADERERAHRFFQAVDEVMASSGCIFPPNGEVDLLRNALAARQLSDAEYSASEGVLHNTRRVGWMRAHRKAGSPFFYVDCDTASILYLAAAERLKMPVCLVDVPGHMFVRWNSETLSLNWDPNEGRVIEDGEYFRRWAVTPEMQRLLGYGECRSETYLRSYWEWLVAQWHCRRGDYLTGEKHLRAALRIAPGNLNAQNELAWFLATCPDDSVRNGTEAVALAESLVQASRRINWLDTLAAAYAETANFKKARETITEARAASALDRSAIARNELVSDLTATADAYAANLSYVQAVRAGKIHTSVAPAAENDLEMEP